MPIWGASSGSVSSKASGHRQPGRKGVQVILLNGDHLQLYVEVKTKAQELFDQVCFMLGVKDTQFFGLCLENGREYDFVDPKQKLSKYAPKGWKSDSSSSADDDGSPSFAVHFRVQLFVEHVSLIKDEVARHHYYLQLQVNVLSAPVLCREEACFVLASYALQADLGNYSEYSDQDNRYFEPAKYFPHWVIKRRGENYILRHVPAMHGDQHGTSRALAQRAFIREASTTIEHTMHFYRLKKTKTEEDPSIWLGISTRGIQLYKDSGEGKYLLCEYAWGNIKRLLFHKKKFELHVDGVGHGKKITYYTVSEVKSKHLLRLCKLSHSFQMQTQTAVDSAKKRESTGDRRYRESYISGDVSWSDMDSSMTTTSYSEASASNLGIQRRSVVSNVSSLGVSGISEDGKLDNRLSTNDQDTMGPDGVLASASDKLPLDYRPAATLAAIRSGSMRRDPLMSGSSRRMKRHSAAMSTDSSHYTDSPGGTVNRMGSGWGGVGSLQPPPVDEVEPGAQQGGGGDQSRTVTAEERESDIDWESEDDVDDPEVIAKATLTPPPEEEDEEEVPPTIIDPQSIQAEIAAKEMNAPFLSALCNDRSLLMMHQAYLQRSAGIAANRNEIAGTLGTPNSNENSSAHEVSSADNDLNNSVTTLVSHSSIESNLHNCFMDLLHTGSSNFLAASPTAAANESFAASVGHLAKHQTMSDLGEEVAEASMMRLTLELNNANKCATLPPKINASEQMLLMAGAATVIREDVVSHSAPNLSPEAQVAVAQ